MKILHTSDWHLGRDFGPVPLLDVQETFLGWLVDLVRDRRIDLVVVAGDLFDRAYAPAEAIRIFGRAVRDLRAAGAVVAAITGNHDGADRVANYGALLDHSGTYVRGGYDAVGEVLTLAFADGPLDLVLLPFLDPQAAPDSLGADEETPADADEAFARRVRRTHEGVLAAAIGAVAPKLVSSRSVAVAHAFVAGGVVSDSERQLTIGGTAAVPAAGFARFSYTALGHLHRPQSIDGWPTVRYSGTPLAYSFSEGHPKSVTIVDMAADGHHTVEEVRVPVGRRVHTVEGRLEDLLGAEPTAAERDCFVRAVVTDPSAVLDAKPRLARVYPHVVEIELCPTNDDGSPVTPAPLAVDRRRLTPPEIADAFWLDAVKTEPTAAQREALHAALRDAQERLA